MEQVMLENKLCYAECPYLISRQEEYDDEPMGFCTKCKEKFVGSMDNIRTKDCYCVEVVNV